MAVVFEIHNYVHVQGQQDIMWILKTHAQGFSRWFYRGHY